MDMVGMGTVVGYALRYFDLACSGVRVDDTCGAENTITAGDPNFIAG